MVNPIPYLLFRLKAKNEYSLHSPFLFSLYTRILKRDSATLSNINIASDIRYLLTRKKQAEYRYPFNTSLPKRYNKALEALFQTFRYSSLLYISAGETLPVFSLYTPYKDTLHITKQSNQLSELIPFLPSLEMIIFEENSMEGNNSTQIINKLLPLASTKTLFILKGLPPSIDIDKKSWNTLISNTKVTLSLNLYFMRLVFFNPKLSKQHFDLKM